MFSWSDGYYAETFVMEGYDQEEVGIPPSCSRAIKSYTDAEKEPIVVKMGKSYQAAHSKDILGDRQLGVPKDIEDSIGTSLPATGTVLIPKEQKQMERIVWPQL